MPLSRTLFLALAVACCATVVAAQSNSAKNQKHQIAIETGSDRYGAGVEILDPKLLGVEIYPGAKVDKEESDGKGANLSLDWGQESTHLYVQKFVTPEPPDKVLAFYRKQLAKFGAVQECRDGKPLAEVKSELKCDAEDSKGAKSDKGIELMAGTKARRHVVGVEPQGSGTKFVVLYVEQTKRGTL